MVGRRKGATAMTSAQRQKNYRDRKRDKLTSLEDLMVGAFRYIEGDCPTFEEARAIATAALTLYEAANRKDHV
jgi:hypothetical protein